MTDWTEKLVTFGSGFVAYRLMIEGWPHEWVTDPRITHNVGLDLRATYPGLSYEGLVISEQMVLRDAWPEASGITAKIVPTDANEDTLNSFTRDPRVVSSLAAPIAAGDTTWTTKPTLVGLGVFHLGSESVLQAIDNTTITRAYWDTEAQDHDTFEGTKENPVPIYNWPPTMEGRRAYLYAYGPNDDPNSDGEVIWRGVVARPPRMDSDGVSWNIEISPITAKFDQNVGASDEIQYKLRGVYHSADSPMRISMWTNDDGDLEFEPLEVHGFYETQDAFANAVNTQLTSRISETTGNAALITEMSMSYTLADSKYSFYFKFFEPNDEFPVILYVQDAIDGDLDAGSPGDPRPNGSPPASGFMNLFAGDADGTLLSPSRSRPPWGYPLPAARTIVGRPYVTETSDARLIRFYSQYPVNDPSAPSDRVYLEQVDGLSVDDVLLVKNGDQHGIMRVTAIDETARYITVEVIESTTGSGIFISSDSIISPLKMYADDGNWVDFIEGIKSQAHAANLGKTPWITAQDVNTSAWADYWDFDNYPFHNYWRHRSYRFGKQVRVRDVFAPELMMTGWMARLGLDGRLDVAQMPFIAGQRSAQWSLTDDEILLPSDELVGMFPTWEAQPDGLVNIVKARLGYDVVEDEFAASGDYTVRMTQSIAEHKSGDKASQTIEVRSRSASYPVTSLSVGGLVHINVRARATITASDVVDMLVPYLRALSTDYAIVQVAVPFTKFGILVGDIVSVSSAFIPDGFGHRGVVNKKAICLGRTWNLDPAGGERMGVLTLWFARDSGRVSGYAPTGRIGTHIDLGGNQWNLRFRTDNNRNLRWSEEGDALVLMHFAIGDTIQIVQVDQTSPTIIKGTITGMVDESHCIVQLEDAWTPGSTTWNMRFFFDTLEVDPLQLTLRQAGYCWVADDTGIYLRSQFSGDYPSAREFI